MKGEDKASVLAAIFGVVTCDKFFSCDSRSGADAHGGFVLWFLLMLYMFKALGTICDEYFVPSLEVIVEKLQVSNDVAGATFMAAGSSAPELFTSLVATFLIVNAGGVGTIVGSAIFNILVMNGVTAYVACKEQELKIWWYPLARDTCFYSLAIVELVMVLYDEEVRWYEGSYMILTYLLYCIYMKYNPNVVEYFKLEASCEEASQPTPEDSWWDPAKDGPNGSAKVMPEESQETPAQTVGRHEDRCQSKGSDQKRNDDRCMSKERSDVRTWSYRNSAMKNRESTNSSNPKVSQMTKSNSSSSQGAIQRAPSTKSVSSVAPVQEPEDDAAENSGENPQDPSVPSTCEPEEPPQEPPSDAAEPPEREEGRRSWCRDPLSVLWEFTLPPAARLHGFSLFFGSIAWIGVCTYIMVDSTNRMGIMLRVPSFVMGLIFLAAGTSIPDTLGSIAVAKQGEGDMAIANALGSNVFDILIGLGVPWTIRAIFIGDLKFKDQFDDLIGDIIILAVVLLIFVIALVINKWTLNRKIGFVLIGFYFLFVTYQLLAVFVVKSKRLDPEDPH